MPKLELISERGPWPFITRLVFRSAEEGERVWSSRHHRKGLLVEAAAEAERFTAVVFRCLWSPRELNWWIGVVFAAGSLLFATASVLSLAPGLASAWELDAAKVNACYFAGSVPFTIAAYLQLYQAANAAPFLTDDCEAGRGRTWIGWRPHDIGWLSCALQLVGTVLFNVNTLAAMVPSLTWWEQELTVWMPDFAGSVLFLLSGYLAFAETCHGYWAWLPGSVSWWVVAVNLLGCVGFMVASLFSVVMPGSSGAAWGTMATAFTLQGAVCFLAGSLLMLPEMSLQSARAG